MDPANPTGSDTFDKIAIVGTAPTSRHLAPFDDPTWQIWSCSSGNIGVLPRCNVWFEMHAIEEMMSPKMRANSELFYKWLKQQTEESKFTVVMIDAGTELGGVRNRFVPKAVPYPLDKIVERFNTRNWFTSSVAYMMALAIMNGAKEIALFGVDMAAGIEHYEAQRAACTYWIEKAESLGVAVSVPMESSLNTPTRLYGYWEGTPFGRRLNAVRADLEERYAAAAAQEGEAARSKIAHAAAIEQLHYMQNTWTDGMEMTADLGQFAPQPPLASAVAAVVEPPVPLVVETPSVLDYEGDAQQLKPAPAFLRPNGLDHTASEGN